MGNGPLLAGTDEGIHDHSTFGIVIFAIVDSVANKEQKIGATYTLAQLIQQFEDPRLVRLTEPSRTLPPVDSHLAMVAPTMIDKTTNISERFISEIEAEFPGVVAGPIAETANIRNEQAEGQTLFSLGTKNLYDTSRRSRQAYRALTVDLLDRLEAR